MITLFRVPGRLYGVRALGWQLDYRPTGWLPLSIREGRASARGWRVLRLGRFGCVTLGRLTPVGRGR